MYWIKKFVKKNLLQNQDLRSKWKFSLQLQNNLSDNQWDWKKHNCNSCLEVTKHHQTWQNREFMPEKTNANRIINDDQAKC